MLEYNKIKIGIINLEINNLYSIYNIFKEIGYKTSVIKSKLQKYDFIILPGVGSFNEGMRSVKKNNLIEELKETIIIKKKKIVGLCLGMQMLFTKSSEYKNTNGLGFIDGNVEKLPSQKLTIPIVGWYKTKSVIKEINKKFFYHIHSYYCNPINKDLILSKTLYHNFSYCSAIQKENIIGFQFHPEKSGINGFNLLKKIPFYY
jgi:glutamine amidotransferase